MLLDSDCRELIFRADAGDEIGTGHVMRFLALAQAWRAAGGHAIFVMAAGTSGIDQRLMSEGMEVVRIAASPGDSDDAARTADIAARFGAGWLVIDGYHFGPDYVTAATPAGARVALIDDLGRSSCGDVDIVVNQNLHATEDLYPIREPATRLLLGSRHVLLRREFLQWMAWRREIPEAGRKVLLSFGGADSGNVTLTVLDALEREAIGQGHLSGRRWHALGGTESLRAVRRGLHAVGVAAAAQGRRR
jgi:UDP-2,4-diacetamido-2,4,6-trideoxy-beta-L-altropyranose hydrolase